MTTIIDHAINIPAPTQIVWALISNPEQFPRWQSDCQRVAFLTTQRRGKNTRLRCMGDSGKEYVMEISAWYEGLGYEYKIVDGAPYESNQGRLRLQEIAEGTVVQWTFSYSLAGVLGSLRNMGVRRAAESQVVDSLRNLYRFVRDSAGENNIKLVKSLMQDAPDVDQRATYMPRHPTQYDEERIRQTGGTARPVPLQRTTIRPIMDEPLPAEDDTQRNRPVTPPAAAARIEAPAIQPTTPQPPIAAPNAQYARPINPTEPPAVRPAAPRPESRPTRPPTETRRDYSTTIPPVPDRTRESTQSQAAVRPPAAPPTEQRPAAQIPVPIPMPAARIDINPLTTPPPLDMRPLPATEANRPPTSATRTPPAVPPVSEKAAVSTDTGKMSVFELFGLPKPSETQQMKAVNLPLPRTDTPSAAMPPVEPAKTDAPAAVLPVEPPVPAPLMSAAQQAEGNARAAFQVGMPQMGDVTPEAEVRQGWRALHRRQMLSLRRPTKPQ